MDVLLQRVEKYVNRVGKMKKDSLKKTYSRKRKRNDHSQKVMNETTKNSIQRSRKSKKKQKLKTILKKTKIEVIKQKIKKI
jgi:hypothetical protein